MVFSMLHEDPGKISYSNWDLGIFCFFWVAESASRASRKLSFQSLVGFVC